MKSSPLIPYHEAGSVKTIHILENGEVISSMEDYLKVQDRFSWVDRKQLIAQLLHIRSLTDKAKNSVMVVYEKNKLIRQFINVDENFKPLLYC